MKISKEELKEGTIKYVKFSFEDAEADGPSMEFIENDFDDFYENEKERIKLTIKSYNDEINTKKGNDNINNFFDYLKYMWGTNEWEQYLDTFYGHTDRHL